jgi:cytoskeletal protein RodZ
MAEYQVLPSRRPLMAYIIGGIVIVVAVMLLMWLVFFRHTAPQGGPLVTAPPSQSAKSSDNKSGASDDNSKTNDASNTGSDGQAGQLSNAGPGNVAMVFALAATTGGVAHYLYRRRRQAAGL